MLTVPIDPHREAAKGETHAPGRVALESHKASQLVGAGPVIFYPLSRGHKDDRFGECQLDGWLPHRG